jgi:hypothetical protein
LNPHALAGTSPSSWRVCLFRHSDGRATEISARRWYRATTRPPESGSTVRIPRPARPWAAYCPGSDGVVLLVASGVRTAQNWAYQRRLLLRGVGVTPPIFRLQTSALGSGYKGSDTISSHSWVSACAYAVAATSEFSCCEAAVTVWSNFGLE